MPLTSLFLFAMVLAVPGEQIQPAAPPIDQSSYVVTADAVTPAQSFQLSPSQPTADKAETPTDDVCYKIRAYIFKRDDDHAPEFVRSTTCGPNQPHSKNAIWPNAKVVPAD
jgi:hypothetical protein